MTIQKEEENHPTPTQNALRNLSRREFLKRTLPAISAAVFFPELITSVPPVWAQQNPTDTIDIDKSLSSGPTSPLVTEQMNLSDTPGYNWEEVYGYFNQYKAKKPDNLKEVNEVQALLDQFRDLYEVRAIKSSKFYETMNQDKDQNGTPKLISLYERFLGKVRSIKPEDLIPFANIKEQMDFYFGYVRQTLKQASENNLKPSLKINAQGKLTPDNSVQDYEIIKNIIGHAIDIVEAKLPESKEKQNPLKIVIEPDPNIVLDAGGLEQYESDTKRIEQFLDRYPYFRKICSKIVLSSHRYGKYKTPKPYSIEGTFSDNYDPKSLTLETVWVDMGWDKSDTYAEIVFAHEAFGHGLDVTLNHDLVNKLTPEEYYERLAFQLQILENPDWADHDGSIPQLFNSDYALGNDYEAIFDSPKIGTLEFMKIILDYPRNVILQNGLNILGGITTIIDNVIASSKDKKTAEADKWSQVRLKNLQAYDDQGVKDYLSLDGFSKDYVPLLKDAVQRGNNRAKIILWGLKHFPNEFENFQQVWRTQDKNGHSIIPLEKGFNTADIWSNYCNYIIVNAVIYHAFLNGEEEIRSLFSPIQQASLERAVVDLRRRSRAELSAQGIAFSYYFGDRMKDKPPYRGSLEEVANMLLKSA